MKKQLMGGAITKILILATYATLMMLLLTLTLENNRIRNRAEDTCLFYGASSENYCRENVRIMLDEEEDVYQEWKSTMEVINRESQEAL